MTPLDVAAIVAAGFGAGAMNAAVGSGSLISFPTLVALGYPPVVANVTNAIGLIPGSVAGAIAYREQLVGQRERVVRLGSASALGAVIGAVLLVALPSEVFTAVVPVLVGFAVLLVLVQPLISRRFPPATSDTPGTVQAVGVGVSVAVLLTGVYGGYFGAAQGVILIAILTIGLREGVHRANALKNILAGLANLAAGIVFAFTGLVDWRAAALIALGATLGGMVGGRSARSLPPAGLRLVVVIVGVGAFLSLLA